jgi:hypothetical protein
LFKAVAGAREANQLQQGRIRVDEAYFWGALEYRICREFAGMPERHMQYMWCDGLVPVNFLLDDPTPRIIGQAWICNGPKQAAWEFTLFLPGPVGSRAEIIWAALLPAEDVTRWLAFDPVGKRIQIEPGAAVPDPA